MTESIVVAIITGVLTLIGTVISVFAANRKTEIAIKVNQAVTDTKLEELTREVRAHNGFAQRLPVVERDIENLTRRIENLEHHGNDGK